MVFHWITVWNSHVLKSTQSSYGLLLPYSVNFSIPYVDHLYRMFWKIVQEIAQEPTHWLCMWTQIIDEISKIAASPAHPLGEFTGYEYLLKDGAGRAMASNGVRHSVLEDCKP